MEPPPRPGEDAGDTAPTDRPGETAVDLLGAGSRPTVGSLPPGWGLREGWVDVGVGVVAVVAVGVGVVAVVAVAGAGAGAGVGAGAGAASAGAGVVAARVGVVPVEPAGCLDLPVVVCPANVAPAGARPAFPAAVRSAGEVGLVLTAESSTDEVESSATLTWW